MEGKLLIIDTASNVSGHIALLKNKNVGVVGRYFSSTKRKCITKSEALLIAGARIKLFTVFENTGDPPLDGDAGTSHGKLALQQAHAIGQPAGSAIYFALEHPPNGYKKEHIPGIKKYFQQIRAVLGNEFLIGAYSNGVVLDALLKSGLADYAWLMASRSFDGSQSFYKSGRWALAQDPHIDQKWDGLKVDLNEAKNDFGQFALAVADMLIAESSVAETLVEDQQSIISIAASSATSELSNIEFPLNNFVLTPKEITGPDPAVGGRLLAENVTLLSPSQRAIATALANTIRTTPDVLQYAKNIASAIVDGPANHCAATLSALLVFVGIFPNGGGTGAGDLEPAVVKLDWDLRSRRGWTKIPLDQKFYPGNIGVVLAPKHVHHIYLVVDSTDQKMPVIADNQLAGIHARPIAGDPAKNFSPTSYFLRAPT